ncbi:MAG: putative DNA-binding domain [Actinomycetota bacterium]|jgi:dihydrofolate reductase
MAQVVRVQNFCVSLDGFGAGVGQSLEAPFGRAIEQGDDTPRLPLDLVSWVMATANWAGRSEPGGSRGIDDRFTRDYDRNIGAEIMGRNKFSPFRGAWEQHDWQGWWGDTPPFRTPVFVLTHHPRPSLTLADTTFHFVAGSPAEVLSRAKEAADGKDVRIGGGVSTIRQFLEADLVDEMHVAVAPITIGDGERLWSSPEELHGRFNMEAIDSPSGVTHLLFWRR